MSPLMIRAVILMAGAAVAFSAGFAVNGWRLGEQIAQMERDQIKGELSAVLAAGVQEAEWSKNLEDARNEATKREIAIRADAGRARTESDGLRADLAELHRQLPELAADACRQRADTLAELFGSCTERYTAVAERADRHASDVQTMIDGWPK